MLYNNLMTKILENIEETLLVVDGTKLPTWRTENTLECLQHQKTPDEWIKHSYPASPSISVFINNLKERVQFIRECLSMAQKDQFNMKCFWLPGFFNQRNFFTSLIQIHARKTKMPMEKLKLHFKFMDEMDSLKSFVDRERESIFYINGLWLYGASLTIGGGGANAVATLEDLPDRAQIGKRVPTIEVRVVQEEKVPRALEK